MSNTRKRTTTKTYKLLAGSLAVALLLLVRLPSASAALVISIDMDPTTAGIQSSLTIVQGNAFDIDVVVTSDGFTLFETAIFQVDFNDTGSVLGLMGGPTAGSLALMSPFVIDAFSPSPILPGAPLLALPAPPTPPYTATSGQTGLLSLAGPFFLPPLSVTDIFGLNFDTLALGTSTLSATSGMGPFGGGLAFGGLPVPFTTVGGTVTVTAAPVIPPIPNPIPEPTILMLFGLGLFGLATSKSRKGTN